MKERMKLRNKQRMERRKEEKYIKSKKSGAELIKKETKL
jgi:hypothetical protein